MNIARGIMYLLKADWDAIHYLSAETYFWEINDQIKY